MDPLLQKDPFRAYRNAYWGGSFSFLPQLGVALEIGGVWRRDTNLLWSWELEFTGQFVDDETFVDTEDPGFDFWLQAQAGVKVSTHPLARRHWTGRAGLSWFYVQGEPNIVADEGHFFAPYVGIGFEADLTDHLTMGPELSLMLTYERTFFKPVPQFNWHVIWNL